MIYKHADDRTSDVHELQRLHDESQNPRERRIVEAALQDLLTGQRGEKSVAHHLDRAYRDSDDIAVFHDLRLNRDGDVTQIDHLIVERLSGRACVIETKNYSGSLSCTVHDEWVVTYKDKSFPLPSPIRQARRHATTLEQWLRNRGHEWIKDVTPVVVIPAKAVLVRANMPADAVIIREDAFEDWWSKKVNQDDHGDADRQIIKTEYFRDLMLRLLSDHTPEEIDWRSRLTLSPKGEQIDEPSRDALKAANQLLSYMWGDSSTLFGGKGSGSTSFNFGRGERGVSLYLSPGVITFQTTDKGDCYFHAGGAAHLTSFIKRCAHGQGELKPDGWWFVPAPCAQRVLATLLEESARAHPAEGSCPNCGHGMKKYQLSSPDMVEELRFSVKRIEAEQS